MSVQKTIEAIRAIQKDRPVLVCNCNPEHFDGPLMDAVFGNSDGFKALADAYEALESEHQEMMRFFGIEYEMIDGERHWKHSPASMKKFRLIQNDAEYEALKAENAELREALKHYADRQTWACGNTGYLHECGCDGQKTGDCSKCYYNSYQGDGQGWETAQAALEKHKPTAPELNSD